MPLWETHLRGGKLIAALTVCTCQGFLVFGYDQGVMSGIIGADNAFGRYFGNPDANAQGNITALFDIGCAAGAILSFLIGEELGRRKMTMLAGIIMILGTIVLASSVSVGQLIAGRILTGVGMGINCATTPVYLAECCTPKHRGTILSIQGLTSIVGMLIAYWLDYGTSFYDTDFQWRFPLAFQGFFAVNMAIFVIWLPDSPRWLVLRDRVEEAKTVLSALHNLPEDHAEVQLNLLEIQTAQELASRGGPFKYKELFSGGKLQNWRRTIITAGIMVMQQWTGANFINYYAPVVYQTTMGMPRHTSLILGGCTAVTYLIGSFISLYTTDGLGRRVVLMGTSAGLSMCFVIASILLSLNSTSAAYGAVAMVFLFQTFLGIGWHPVAWFYPVELNTTRLRSKATAIMAASNWLTTFVVVKITPIAINSIGWKTFIIFAVLNALWIPIIYCFFPETKGLSLEDIDHIFEKGGFTGGVFSTRGRTVVPSQHRQEVGLVAEGKGDHALHIENSGDKNISAA
ncbi:sugar transporter [Thozetella sp. PMI_491]|nr:sugar transporter [Thozetella sp. PMI_491]